MTKITLGAEAMKLIKKVAALKKGKYSVPVLEYLKFTVLDDSQVSVMFCDSELTVEKIIYAISVENLSSKSFLVHTDVLKKVKGIKTNSIYSFETDGQSVTFNDNGVSKTSNAVDEDSYPTFPTDEYEKMVALNKDLLSKLQASTLSASPSETRPILTQVCMRQDSVIATDSHRLYKTEYKGKLGEQDFVISPLLIAAVASVEKNDKNFFGVIHLGNYHVLIETMTGRYCYRRVEGNFPDISRLIPTEFRTEFDIQDTTKFMGVLNACYELTKDSEHTMVTFEINDRSLLMYSQTEAGEKVTEELDIIPDGKNSPDKLKIAFSSKFLLDAIKQLGTEKITFHMATNHRPFLVSGKDKDSRALILPVRTN